MVVKKLPNRYFLFSFVFIFCMFFLIVNAPAGMDEHITRTESGFYYTIQKGDTLWDLSKQFSNSPWEWPEMWRYNPTISNPHLIYPGQKILIYKKEWEGKEKQPELAAKKPELKTVTYHVFNGIDRIGFIREKAVAPLGTIFKALGDVSLIHTGTQVYIYPAPGAPGLSVGTQYTLFRTIDPILDKKSGKNYGVQHLLTGTVEITSMEPDFAIGKIISAYRDIQIKDHLMPYGKKDINITIRESKKGLAGKIIKSEENNTMLAKFSIVFINKGNIDGVEPGQYYSLYLQESARPEPDKTKSVMLTPYKIGEVLVLHTERTTSTALITNSKQQITPGILVRPLQIAGP